MLEAYGVANIPSEKLEDVREDVGDVGMDLIVKVVRFKDVIGGLGL